MRTTVVGYVSGVDRRPALRVWALKQQSANADAIVDKAMAAGLDGSDPLTVRVKTLRADLLLAMGDLERELLDCVVSGVPAHYVGGLRTRPARRTRRRSSSLTGVYVSEGGRCATPGGLVRASEA
jgi:hypothetical protein